jgi:hypothetical protein
MDLYMEMEDRTNGLPTVIVILLLTGGRTRGRHMRGFVAEL